MIFVNHINIDNHIVFTLIPKKKKKLVQTSIKQRLGEINAWQIAFQNSILTHVFFNIVLFQSEYSKVLYLHGDNSFGS